MKTRLCLALAFLIMSVAGKCQERFNLKGRSSSKTPVTCFDAGVGYIPDDKYKVFTVTFAGNNLANNRYGLYALAEVNFKTPTLVIGPTLSVNYYSYIFGGIDFLTSRGIFGQAGLKHSRKDLGVGFYPIKWATVKVAYSFHAGPRAEIGIRIPVDKRQ